MRLHLPLDRGLAARRAVVRWAWRMFRREWRQQILVVGLLVVAVGATVLGVTVAYNLTSAAAGRFGNADLFILVDGSDPDRRDADLAAIDAGLADTELIGSRNVQAPGSFDPLELRSQDPDGPLGNPMLDLRRGRYPTAGDQMAVTDDVAATFGLSVGDRFTVDATERTVVGVVENPGNLHDEFALVSPGALDLPETVTVLVDADRAEFRAFQDASGSAWDHEWRGSAAADTASGTLAFATVGMLLVGLVSAAGFVVVAQRRLRHLGLIAAIGATAKHLRLVMVANGLLVGASAAVAGTVVAIAGWLALAPRLEPAAGHRIDATSLPVGQIGLSIAIAIVTATVAAWWPARMVSRLPITTALSARPPRPRPVRRRAVVAALLVLCGLGCLILADQTNGGLVVAGTVAVAVGMMLASPVAVSLAGRTAQRFRVGARLALRDLSRYQVRSAAALAAISFALGIPVAIVVTATAAEWSADAGNLSDRQLMVRVVDVAYDVALAPDRTPAQLARLGRQVGGMAAAVGDARVVPLAMAIRPDAESIPSFEGGDGGLRTVSLGQPVDENTMHDTVSYVATPDVLDYYGIDAATVDPDTDVFTALESELLLPSEDRSPPEVITDRVQLDTPAYQSAPITLFTPAALRRHGWETTPAAWLIETAEPLTSDQRAAARDLASDAGLTVETRFDERQLWVLRDGATLVGAALALGIVAMAVGLVRTEAAGDLRTLTATGASSRVRRTVTSTTAGALALLGVGLGTVGAYLALGAGYLGELSTLRHLPLGHLATLIVGVPVAAAAAGWLVAGREPRRLSRAGDAAG
ncbi:MAG: ABC transporter permease [Acidimicrobiales bacterium]